MSLKNILFTKTIPAQIFQNFSIGLILLVGKISGIFNISWFEILVTLGTVIVADFLMRWFFDGGKKFPNSGLNSGIGICLFLRSDQWIVYFFTALIAIVSKYIIRIKDKHFFNPSYAAIFLTLVLFPSIAYLNPLQWQVGGNNFWTLALILVLGSITIFRQKLWGSTLVYLISFLGIFLLLRDSYPEAYETLIFTGTFFLYLFFGYTDPATIPAKKKIRALFMLQIVLLFFLLHNIINENYALLAAYFVVQLLEVPFWLMEEKSEKLRFKWQSIVTIFLAMMLLWQSVSYKVENNRFPPVLQNRCNQIVCNPTTFHQLNFFGLFPIRYYNN